MSIIIYELNEVPRKLFDFYSDAFPSSAFALLRNQSRLFKTFTADIGNLSPWITWPTMHRGVSNVDHEISELGQNLKAVNKDFPNVYEILAKSGIQVGVFGSLHSYPLPDELENYCFYVPDTFAAENDCYPDHLTEFQSFNLSMVRKNGRNVSGNIDLKRALGFLRSSVKLGVTPSTFSKIARQIVAEKINKDRLVRRRTSQIEIAFDLYFHQLKETRPDISFFFTNHLASSMHRYWPSVFPEDYGEGHFDEHWLARWSAEIPHAVRVANYQLAKLMDYCKKSGSELVVCGSMGQGAVENVEPLESQILITNLKRLMIYIGLTEDEWEPKLAMAPRVVFTPRNEACLAKLQRLDDILVNGHKVEVRHTASNDIRLNIMLTNQKTIEILDNGEVVPPGKIGIENVHLQDASGSYAYHIPEGILLHYEPHLYRENDSNTEWTEISALDFAPSILHKFSVTPPSYMAQGGVFFQ